MDLLHGLCSKCDDNVPILYHMDTHCCCDEGNPYSGTRSQKQSVLRAAHVAQVQVRNGRDIGEFYGIRELDQPKSLPDRWIGHALLNFTYLGVIF